MAKKGRPINELVVAECKNAKCEVRRMTVTAYPFVPHNMKCPACGRKLGDRVNLDYAVLTQEGRAL